MRISEVLVVKRDINSTIRWPGRGFALQFGRQIAVVSNNQHVAGA